MQASQAESKGDSSGQTSSAQTMSPGMEDNSPAPMKEDAPTATRDDSPSSRRVTPKEALQGGGDPNRPPRALEEDSKRPQRVIAELGMAKVTRAIYSERRSASPQNAPCTSEGAMAGRGEWGAAGRRDRCRIRSKRRKGMSAG